MIKTLNKLHVVRPAFESHLENTKTYTCLFSIDDNMFNEIKERIVTRKLSTFNIYDILFTKDNYKYLMSKDDYFKLKDSRISMIVQPNNYEDYSYIRLEQYKHKNKIITKNKELHNIKDQLSFIFDNIQKSDNYLLAYLKGRVIKEIRQHYGI